MADYRLVDDAKSRYEDYRFKVQKKTIFGWRDVTKYLSARRATEYYETLIGERDRYKIIKISEKYEQ